MTLHLVPVNLATAQQFVTMWHRHLPPPRGHKFSIGVAHDDGQGDELSVTLVGVIMVGRPIARAYDDGTTLEVRRSATDGTEHANSKLYAAAWRATKALGYRRLITYTQAGETGASLRAAGWRIVAERPARKGWDTPSRHARTGTKPRSPAHSGRHHDRPLPLLRRPSDRPAANAETTSTTTPRVERTPMSGKIIGEVMRYAPADLTPRERFVLVALAESARDNGPTARISRTNAASIAEQTGYAYGAVRNALAELSRRCLIYPQHAKTGKGTAQDYRIVQLESHHRAATTRYREDHRAAPTVSSGSDTVNHAETEPPCHPGVTRSPVDNSADDNRPCHRAAPTVSSGSDTPRKDSPVTTVSSNSSRQVTVEPRTENELPPSLRSVAPDDTPTATPPVSRGSSPPTTRQPDRRASRRRPKRKR